MPLYTAVIAVVITLSFAWVLYGKKMPIGRFRAASYSVGAVGGIFSLALGAFIGSGAITVSDHGILGPQVYGIPLEGIVYPMAVAFAVLVVYERMRRMKFTVRWGISCDTVLLSIASVSAILLSAFSGRPYLVFVSTVCLGVCISHVYFIKKHYHMAFLMTFLSLLVPYMMIELVLVRGIAAMGIEPIVRYADWAVSGVSIFSVSIASILFFFSLTLSSIAVYEKLRQ